ncbi:MAG: chaperone modulator CbpM [Casimicrobiaceae bacterium]
MNIVVEQALTLDEQGTISYSELVTASGVPEDALRELVRYGALAPLDPAAPTWTFSAHALIIARKVQRLRTDFELDTHAVAVVLSYLERIEMLEAQLGDLRARMR